MRSTRGEKIFYAINYAFVTLVALTCLLPLIYEISLSFSSSRAISSGWVSFWPIEFCFDNYTLIFKGTPILRAFKNSVIITGVGTAFSMCATILAAYPLSKPYMYARKQMTMLCVFTMLFGGGMIPTYLVIRDLGIIDTYWALWLPGLVSTYNMLVMRTFFTNISSELEDAARIDGCNEIRLLLQIFLPLSLPCIATIALFYAVGFWNMFQSVLIYINSTAKHNLSVLVNNMIREQLIITSDFIQAEDISTATPQGVQAAGIIVMIFPIMCVYPFLQRYFVKGVMLGSVKG
ncbi:MAG: carbohydrate ABC transporter permease [Eubacteriales bacterium]|nr:carbohydrate ABC transporter permease [Eubacteriales bacterium]